MTNTHDTAPFTDVDQVLRAAAAPPSPAELAGEASAVSMFRGAIPAASQPGRPSRRRLASRAGLVAAGAFGLFSVGSAAAATGALPDTAQDAAHTALTKVGVDVPRGKGTATAPGQVKKTTGTKAAKPAKTKGSDSGSTASNGKGATISSIAHDPSLSGAEKGAAVSNAASEGKSHAGEEHGPPSSVPGGRPAESPSVTAPGKTTASTAGPRGATPPGKP